MPLHINKLESSPDFANPKEVARGQEPGGKAAGPRPGRVSGPAPNQVAPREGRLCAAVPGLQGRGRESAVWAFPQDRKPSWRTQAPLSFLTHVSPRTYGGSLGNSHLTENGVPRLPREQASMFESSQGWPPSPPQLTPASWLPLGAGISHLPLTSRHSDPAR